MQTSSTAHGAASTPWLTAWTPEMPFHLDYGCVRADTPWAPGPYAGMQYRDLGLKKSSAGKMGARHLRMRADAAPAPIDWRALETDFHFMYVLAGSAALQATGGVSVRLDRGMAAWLPPYYRHRIDDFSSDFEMFEMLAPAQPRVFAGRDAELPDRAGQFAGQRGQFLAEKEDSFVQGAGPRKFFLYRDLGTSGPSGGRIHIHIVQAIEPMPGGTGWHTHSMRQLFWVLRGSAGFEIQGHKDVKRVDTHDAVCVAQGQAHDVPSFSADYQVLEICMPAEYDTVATQRPG